MPMKVAVVIPTYKEELNPLEKISLDRCRKILSKYPRIFVAPEGKTFSYVNPDERTIHFPPQYFKNVETYSKLMMSPFFYEAFAEFDYILIYQLDAFVFYDALEEFCSLGYDYIGAPWPYHAWTNPVYTKTPLVGNGGLSLRKVETCRKVLEAFAASREFRYIIEGSVEDAFFAMCGVLNPKIFKTAPVAVAKAFSMEWYPNRTVRRLGNALPFGCHGWNRFSADFYVSVFAQLGYDLRPFRNQMDTKDYHEKMETMLSLVAIKRLIRRAEREQSIARYLPTKRFASVRAFRSPDVMKILSRLICEENSLADKIFIYEKKDWQILLNDLKREQLPHLVLALDNDKKFIDLIEQRGLSYGQHVISLQREYFRYCEELFHNLGK